MNSWMRILFHYCDATVPQQKEEKIRSAMKRSTLDEINVVEILDRVLDKGIVLDPSARMYLLGKELRSTKSRMVLESLQTYS